jgi:type VI secretion system ImpH/TssG family protein
LVIYQTASATITYTLADKLFQEASRFCFAQAIHVAKGIQRAHKKGTIKGEDGDLKGLNLKILSHFSLSPKPSAIQKIELKNHNIFIHINFLSLSGVGGALPPYMDEFIQNQRRKKDASLSDFLTLFEGRLAWIHYTALASLYPSVSHEKMENSLYGKILSSLCGAQKLSDAWNVSIPIETLLNFAPFFFQKRKTLQSLELFLSLVLGQKVRCHSLKGGWIRGQSSEQTRLGVYESTLGHSFLLGKRQWISDQTLILRIDKKHAIFLMHSQERQKLQDFLIHLLGVDAIVFEEENPAQQKYFPLKIGSFRI